jgi:type III restriction enzyme
VFATKKSHVNLVVADTDSWEQIAAKTFEQLPAVESYVKNAFLGFEIPYVDKSGTERRYQPDFLLRVKTPGDEHFNLIVEISGFARDKTEKRWFVQQRWLPAVNAQREQLGLLPWHFIEVTEIERIKEQLEAGIERIAAEVDEAVSKTAWGVFKLIAALPEDVFENIRETAALEHRPGLLDDDEH